MGQAKPETVFLASHQGDAESLSQHAAMSRLVSLSSGASRRDDCAIDNQSDTLAIRTWVRGSCLVHLLGQATSELSVELQPRWRDCNSTRVAPLNSRSCEFVFA